MKGLVFFCVAAACFAGFAGASAQAGRWGVAALLTIAAAVVIFSVWLRARAMVRSERWLVDVVAVTRARVRGATLLDAVEQDAAPVARRLGQRSPQWLEGARWAIDAARRVLREGDL